MSYDVHIPRCTHIKTNGTQCGSPALRGRRFCFFHKNWQGQRIALNVQPAAPLSFTMPVLEDADSVQVALMQVMRLILAGQLDPKIAGLLLYALQTASLNLRQMKLEPLRHESVVIDPSSVADNGLGENAWSEEQFEEEEEEDSDDEDADEVDGDEEESEDEEDEDSEEDDTDESDEEQDSSEEEQDKVEPARPSPKPVQAETRPRAVRLTQGRVPRLQAREFVAIDKADPPTLYPAGKFEDAVRAAIDDKTLLAKVMSNSQSELDEYADNLTATALRNLGLKLEGDTLVRDQGMKVGGPGSRPFFGR